MAERGAVPGLARQLSAGTSVNPELLKPEWNKPPPGADSATSRNRIEAIVYENHQAFPHYLVTYTAGPRPDPYGGGLDPPLRKIDAAPITAEIRVRDGQVQTFLSEVQERAEVVRRMRAAKAAAARKEAQAQATAEAAERRKEKAAAEKERREKEAAETERRRKELLRVLSVMPSIIFSEPEPEPELPEVVPPPSTAKAIIVGAIPDECMWPDASESVAASARATVFLCGLDSEEWGLRDGTRVVVSDCRSTEDVRRGALAQLQLAQEEWFFEIWDPDFDEWFLPVELEETDRA